MIHPGQLNTLVEVMQWVTLKNAEGEAVKSLSPLSKKFVQRKDAIQGEDEEGKLVPLNVVRYIMRYDRDMLRKGNEYVIRDQDGEYEINSVVLQAAHPRNRYMELKCSKRGE